MKRPQPKPIKRRIREARRLPRPVPPTLPEALQARNAAPLRRHFAALVV